MLILLYSERSFSSQSNYLNTINIRFEQVNSNLNFRFFLSDFRKSLRRKSLFEGICKPTMVTTIL